MEKREYLEYGYKAYNGLVLSDAEIDSYNEVQREINNRIDAGYPVGDHLLNRSHFMFKSALLAAGHREVQKARA